MSEAQKKRVRKVRTDYVPPPIEGMYDINKNHPQEPSKGNHLHIRRHCGWKNDFNFCLRKFTLAVFHEVTHVLLGPDMDEYVPYAERVLAEIRGPEKYSNAPTTH